MGIVLTNLLDGIERAHPLLDATTLCGACDEVCPVKVPLLKLFRALRERKAELGLTSPMEKYGMTAFGAAVQSPFLFRVGQAMWRRLWPLIRHIDRPPLNRMPRPAAESFRRRMR
jgi:L-lactate dehydrogenase complex protein LldF